MIRPSRLFACRALALLALFLALPAQAAFTDNGDGTVTDTVTGLMWDKCSWGQSDNATCGGGAATAHTWAQALGVAVSANSASYKGRNDWRLPNKNELESLVKIDASNQTIDTAAFPNTASSWYWTSTNYAPDPACAWIVYFGGGGVEYDGKAIDYNVRLVRSGQSFDSFDAQGGPGVGAGAAGIPTLSEWALLALAGFMGLLGMGALRRRLVGNLPT